MNRLFLETHTRLYLVALSAIALVLMVPLWWVATPAMPDYPAHLAGFYLIAGGAKNSVLAQFYRIDWGFIPNLASEVSVPALAKVFGLNAATKIFLSMAVALWVFAPAILHRALYGRFGLAPLAGALFAYNANFVWGFFNYYFAAGLSLLIFAAWIASDAYRGIWRIAAFAIAILIVYFCHLFAAAFLLLLILCFEIQTLAKQQAGTQPWLERGTAIFVLCMPALCAFLFLRPQSAGGNIAFDFGDTWLDRLDSMLQVSFDRPAWIMLAVLTAALVFGLWRRAISIHPTMRLALAVTAVCVALAPEWAMGGWGVQMRLPAVLAVLIFASTDISLDVRQSVAVVAALIAIALINAAALAGNWRYYDRQYAEFRAAAQSLPEGSRLMTVLDGDAMGWASDQPYWHMAELEIPARHLFTPLMFATPGQHVVQLRQPYRNLAATSAWQGSPPDISELDDLAAGRAGNDKDIDLVFPYLKFFPCHYDDAVVIHSGGVRSPAPDMLRLLHRGSFFDLYAIRRPVTCTKY